MSAASESPRRHKNRKYFLDEQTLGGVLRAKVRIILRKLLQLYTSEVYGAPIYFSRSLCRSRWLRLTFNLSLHPFPTAAEKILRNNLLTFGVVKIRIMSSEKASTSSRFPTLGDLAAILGIVVAMQVVVSLIVTAAMYLGGWDIRTLTDRQQGCFMAASYVGSMLPVYVAVLAWRRYRQGGKGLGRFGRQGLNPALLLWGFLCMTAASVVCEPLIARLPEVSPEVYGLGPWAFAALVIAAPVLEELLCRGVVLEALRARYGTLTAWWGSALFFGVLHLQPALAVNAFVIGLVLGYLYILADSLWATMILHALNNAVAYLLLATGRGEVLLVDMIGNRTLYVAVYIVAAAVTIVAAAMMRRMFRQQAAETKKETAE